MIRFSILITTRTRIGMLHNLLKSIYESTMHKDTVEIHVIYDNDDNPTLEYTKNLFVQTYTETPPVKTYFHSRDRSPDLVNDYHNYYAKNVAQGKYIIFSNDDALFELVGWDDRAWTKLSIHEERFPDGLIYGTPEDYEFAPMRRTDCWMACFPLISKKVVDVLGYAFDPEFLRDGADWALAATFYAINRVVDLRDCIIIKHLSFRSGRRSKDDLDVYAHSLGIMAPMADSFVQRNSEKLLKYIEECSVAKQVQENKP
jgi:hypothetical protein